MSHNSHFYSSRTLLQNLFMLYSWLVTKKKENTKEENCLLCKIFAHALGNYWMSLHYLCMQYMAKAWKYFVKKRALWNVLLQQNNIGVQCCSSQRSLSRLGFCALIIHPFSLVRLPDSYEKSLLWHSTRQLLLVTWENFLSLLIHDWTPKQKFP